MDNVLAFLIAAQQLAGMPDPEQAQIAWVAESGFCEPETVLALPDNTLLVSNVCDYRTEGDGYLSLLNAEGKIIDARRVEGLDSPLGMDLVDDVLFVVDNNTVKIFQWPSYEQRSTISLPTAVANDIAVAGDGKLFYMTRGGVGYALALGDEFKELGQSKLADGGDYSATPAISGNDLFIRSSKSLFCVSGSK